MYEDKFRGMLLLGGFGDALGAPTELHNTAAGNYTQHAWRRRCSLSVASRWYNQTLYPNTWEIWPPPNYIKGLKVECFFPLLHFLLGSATTVADVRVVDGLRVYTKERLEEGCKT